MPKKTFMQRIETRRAMLTGLFVALFVLAAEAVKSTTEFSVHAALQNLRMGDNNFSTAIGFLVAGIMLLFFIWIFSGVIKES
jgi:uncharacterized membrane protein